MGVVFVGVGGVLVVVVRVWGVGRTFWWRFGSGVGERLDRMDLWKEWKEGFEKLLWVGERKRDAND